MNTKAINLNADLGESFGAWNMGDDAAMLSIVNSANIACGFHAGDPLVMQKTVQLALAQGVSLGAHPSFPDLQGFGRRVMHFAADELQAMLVYQIGALQAMARAQGGSVTHVKPHGALNNMACKDRALADTVVRAVQSAGPELIVLAPACSILAEAAAQAGVPLRLEAFADRSYQSDGQLTPRSTPGAVLHEPEACVAHVLSMLEQGGLVTTDGSVLKTPIDSICVHGDGAQAVKSARALRQALVQRGYTMRALDQVRR